MAAVVAERSIIVRAAPFTIGQIKETCGGGVVDQQFQWSNLHFPYATQHQPVLYSPIIHSVSPLALVPVAVCSARKVLTRKGLGDGSIRRRTRASHDSTTKPISSWLVRLDPP